MTWTPLRWKKWLDSL
jgi:predicted dehydrogenase